eukprot:jgi/Chrzof1/354/Cz01g12200.t1
MRGALCAARRVVVQHLHPGFWQAAVWRNSRAFAIGTDTGEETHDDFKPKYKQQPANDVEEQIKKDVSSNKVFIYMKGSPDAPQCGFSNMACRILDAYGVITVFCRAPVWL